MKEGMEGLVADCSSGRKIRLSLFAPLILEQLTLEELHCSAMPIRVADYACKQSLL